MATSNKLRRSKAEEEKTMSVDMSPMIDMVFLLLIFFLVTANMIIVKQDPKVQPPIASHSKLAEDSNGRIVINIYEDGTFLTEEGRVLADEEEITEHVKERKEEESFKGYEAMIHLRGDSRAVFKHCRRVMRASAQAGVSQIKFASYPFSLD